ncbi:hypothetical protein EOL73_02825 [Candidatus Saccharibacteria bacterium]|nr:hypothetical protein [Candidatus Saccharibacteria bacterium]NCU40664.1 hypothetical protein [Candidatus Saccharibacteria bacterium]
MSNNNKGFSIVEIFLVIAVVVIMGLIGWTFYTKVIVGDTTTTDNGNTVTEVSMPEVNNTSDLQKAEDAVKEIDVDGAVDTSDIDASLE